ncbi:hypothetical protein EJB05_52373, partial [Eragrostis curvula]
MVCVVDRPALPGTPAAWALKKKKTDIATQEEKLLDANYTLDGTFQANLDAILSSLPAAAAASWGFAKNTTGAAAPDQAYGLPQCRRDVSAPLCSSCVEKMAQKLRDGCPGRKNAIIFSETCMLRHSNVSFFGEPDGGHLLKYYTAVLNATEPELFATRLDALMSSLKTKAAYGSPLMFAANVTDVAPLVKIYGVAQCTGDLGRDDCYKCLDRAAAYIPSYWETKQGGQSILWSCFVRFEASLFYNASGAEEACAGSGAWSRVDQQQTRKHRSMPADLVEQALVRRSRTPAASDSRACNVLALTPLDIVRRARIGILANKFIIVLKRLKTALLVSVPVAVTLLVLLFVAVYVCKKNRKLHKHVQIASNNEEMGSSDSLQYDLNTLRAATDNFSEQNKLGQGGFGPVYKGKLPNGQNIAVKRLSTTSQQGQAEMKNEVVLVAKLQHKNLVRLFGYCIEKHEMLLVYEFLRNKSLDKILYGPARQQELSWTQRYSIIEGIGRGLMYLHEDSRLKIIHRDLKPGNILLDADMNPKISDFGLAKLLTIDSSVKNTRHNAGTYGYMAPEYAMQGIVSAKSDVFSYGVLVLEIITRRRPQVWRHWHQGNVTQLVDDCPADEHGKQEMLRCIHIGLLCVQDDAQLRPRMAAVIHMLKSRPMTLASPSEPLFEVPGERPRVAALEPSVNKASISHSEVEPR